MMKESVMEENSVGTGSGGNAMGIFGPSIDVRRPGKSRRRVVVTHKNLSPEIEESVGSSRHKLHRRKAVAADQEQAQAESELSRAMNMAMELERQIEQTNAKARSHRSELQRQGTRAGGSRRKTRRGLAAEATCAPAHQEGSSTAYGEVMQELDRVKAELRKLQREVKAATAAKGTAGRDAEASASTSTSRVVSSGPRVDDGVEREEDGASEEHGVLVELSVGAAATTTRDKELQRDKSCASDLGTTRATASSDARPWHGELAVMGATEATAMASRKHEEHEESSLQAAEAELSSARIELESIKAEGHRLTASIERTRRETARVTDEIRRLTEQERKASAQAQQLNAKLLKARSRLEAVTAADERAEETISKLTAILRQLDDDTEAAEKEKTLTETEYRSSRSDAENIEAEIAAAEQRIRESVREIEAARASEAAATARLKAIVESATVATAAASMPQRSSGNVTIPRFEYEYLTGRAEVVRALAEKKAAAVEAWAEAQRASEKEIAMRAEAIERELGEARAADAEDAAQPEQRERWPRAGTSRRPVEVRGSGAAATSRMAKSRRMSSSSAAVVRKRRSPLSSVTRTKRRVLIPKCLKIIVGKCMGQN